MVKPALSLTVNQDHRNRPENRTSTGRRICWYCEGPILGRARVQPIRYYDDPHRPKSLPNPEFCSRSCRAEWRRCRATVGEN